MLTPDLVSASFVTGEQTEAQREKDGLRSFSEAATGL